MNKLSQPLKITCPTVECGSDKVPVDSSIYVHIKNSFKLKYQFVKTINETEVITINPRDINFVFEYYTLDNKDSFIASHLYGCSTNLFINEKEKYFNVIVYKPGLVEGKLMVNYRFITADNEFMYEKSEVTFGEETNIKIIDDPTVATRPGNFCTKVFDFNSDPLQLVMSYNFNK